MRVAEIVQKNGLVAERKPKNTGKTLRRPTNDAGRETAYSEDRPKWMISLFY